MPKYFNNAIIGNSKILCTLSDKAEILRLYYPNIDYFQLVDTYSLGIYDANQVYWFKDSSATNQHYDGNILYTDLKVNDVSVTIRDFVMPNENVIVRSIKFMKPSNLMIYSKLNSDVNKQVSSMMVDNTLIQYCQDMYMATFTNKDIHKYRINCAKTSLEHPNFSNEDYVGMSADAIVGYEDISEITMYITLNSTLNESLNSVKYYKAQMENLLYNTTKKYWDDFISKYEKSDFIKGINKVAEKSIILRSIYMFALLSNHETGAVLACPDVDENYTRCGRYGYCWPRDALFINEALHILGMDDLTNNFYHNWAKKAQMDSGLFEQRYYANGELAPSWGLQIDETAAILIGASRHTNYLFLEDMILKSIVALMNFVDDRGIAKESYDLWEERKGSHLYSTASICYALKCSYDMLKVIDEIKYKSLLERMLVVIDRLKDSIKKNFIKDGVLVRSLDNDQVDISLLCVVTPFNLFNPGEEFVQNTIKEIERTLHMQNGGYMRYQWDSYIGGNTWIIASLWLALYHIETGNKDKARELFDWVTNHADNLYFLPEQIEREGDRTAWISALSWSHAMYVIVRKLLS